MRSRAQWRYLFGTHQPFAERWARASDWSSLPRRVKRAAERAGLKEVSATPGGGMAHGPGGLLSAPGLGSAIPAKKPTTTTGKAWSPAARAAALAARRRNAAARGAGQPTPKKRRAAAPKPAGSGRSRGGGRTAGEREQQRAQNRADTLQKLNIPPEGQQALTALRNGEQPDADAIARGGFEQAGLVERAADGSYRMTAAGRALLSAADAGDAGRAGDTISSARDRAAARAGRAAGGGGAGKPSGAGALLGQASADQTAADWLQHPGQATAAPRSPAETERALAVAERRAAQLQKKLDKLKKGGGGKKRDTSASAAELRAQIRFVQQQQDRLERQARQARMDAQREQDRADRIARRREVAVARPRNNVVSGAGTNRAVVHKAIPPIPEPTRTLDGGHTGVMIALIPDAAAVQALADQPSVTESADQLHLTLAYLGDSTEQPLATNKARLIDTVRQWAAEHGQPLNGTINGAGRFFHSEDDDTNAVFVSPDVPGLPELRQSLCDWVEQSGFDYAQNHGFTPHITVAYVPFDAPTPDVRIDTPVSFPVVTLAWGDEQYDLPMGVQTKAETYGGEKRADLADDVFAGPDRSFPIVTAQDVRDAVHSLGRTNHDKDAVKRGIIRRARAIGATDALPDEWRTATKAAAASFAVYKDARGRYRWVMLSSNAFRDRDGEIVSTKALETDVARADADGNYGPLRWWHMGVPFGPGVDLGTCDFNAMVGRFLVESGTFKTEAIGQAIAAKAADLQGSIGFTHPPSEPDRDGVFWHIHRFERSLVPRGKAANPFTQLYVQEIPPMDKDKVKALADLLGVNPDEVQSLVSATQTKEAKLQAAGVAFKADEPTTTTKAGMVAADPSDPSDVVTEDAMEPDGDEGDGGSDNLLNDSECENIAERVVAKLMPHLGIGGKMDELKSMLGGMAQGYAKKDAEQAALKEAQTAQQAEIAALKARLAELEGDQPRATKGYRASLDTATVVNKEAPAPAADPLNDFIGAFVLGGQQAPQIPNP